MSIATWHYDGISALRRRCELVVEGDSFRLIGDGAADETHAFADLVARDAVDGDAVFALKKRSGWRIGFHGEVPAAVAAHLPRHARYGGVIDRFGLWPSIGVSMVLAAGAITLFLMTPAAIARVIPPSVEREIGDLMVGDLGGRTCNGGNGPAALGKLVNRIDDGDRQIDVRIINVPIVNAVTLPGGRIVIFNGLVRAADSPDEVAGVLAHEIGHVHGHDVMESLLRQMGLSVLLGGLDGNVGGYTNALLGSAYSRKAEGRADGFAIDMLRTAAVSPAPTAAFFERLEGHKKDKVESDKRFARALNYLGSHPISSDRANAFRASARGQTGYRPTLSPEEWKALREICTLDKDVETMDFRF